MNDSTTRFHLLTGEILTRLQFVAKDGAATVRVSDTSILYLKRPTKELFAKQLEIVFARQADREKHAAEIVTQVTPQFAYWSAICGFHPSRHAHLLELIFLLLHCSMLVTQRLKHELATPRPMEYSPLIQPMIQTPAYFAWPSGHATEAYVFAKLMQCLSPQADRDKQLHALARRIADNRVIAGLHFPVDGVAGYVLADAYVDLVARLAGQKTDYLLSRSCDASAVEVERYNDDLSLDDDLYRLAWIKKDIAKHEQGAQATVEPSPMLAWLWKKAQAELSYLDRAA
jgi:hypothetical protein